jgi:outer membrane protein TolC
MKRRKLLTSLIKWTSLYLFVLILGTSASAEDRVNLDDYRKKIQEKSLKISSMNDEQKGALLESKQARYLTTPQAFVEFQDSKDKSPNLTPETSGTENNVDELKIGLQSQTNFGLKPRVYAFTQNQNVKNISSLANPNLSLQRKGYGVEAELSLWKNAFGKDVRNQQQSLIAQSEAKNYQAQAGKIAFELESDHLYFETAYLKEAISIQENLVKQGEKLVNWTQAQSNSRLLEPVHVAQATAAHHSRKAALISYKQQLLSNLLKMSQLTNQKMTEGTILDTPEVLANTAKTPSTPLANKITLKSLSKAVEAERTQLDLINEEFKPDLNLKAQYMMFSDTGRQDDSSRCKSQSDCRAVAVSLNLTVPLDFSSWQTGSKSATSRVVALEKNLQAELQNAQIEKEQLEIQILGFRDQISSLEKLILAQEMRLKKERERQARGRATTFDLIMSEQELGESKIALAEAKTKYISTISQFRLFEEGK